MLCGELSNEAERMTNAQIKCFLNVVRYQSFSKAAEKMFISQSAVSKNIALLEKDLGYILIDRTNGIAKLTAVGEQFYDFFSKAESMFSDLMERVAQMTSRQAEDIRLGCLDGWDLSQFYPQIQKIFSEKYPNANLSLEGYNHLSVLDALVDNKIDIAITLAIAVPRQSSFVSKVIASAPAVILLSSSHPLANKEDFKLSDLKDEPFYVIAPNSPKTNPLEQLALLLCRSAGFEPKIEYAPNSASILMRLQSGRGSQITCNWTSAARFPIYKTIKLEHNLNVCAAWLNNEKVSSKHLFVNELMRLDLNDI